MKTQFYLGRQNRKLTQTFTFDEGLIKSITPIDTDWVIVRVECESTEQGRQGMIAQEVDGFFEGWHTCFVLIKEIDTK